MDLKKTVIAVALVALALPASAKPRYAKALKKWTRSATAWVVDNFEARMIWHATYLSPEFRASRREKMTRLLDWNQEDLRNQVRKDKDESAQFDVFYVSIYAGSSKWPQIGKNDGQWRIVLEPSEGPAVEALQMERIPITQVELELYPYLDKWSQTYYVRFPKTLHRGEAFKIRMSGIPAHSELAWSSK